MSFSREYEKKREYIDELVLRYAEEFDTVSQELARATDYGVLSGGKRLRAIMSLEILNHFSYRVDKSCEIFLAAIELFHLYTLIHDDLPCMDNDDFRRGKPSLHRAFGESMALLCGDALLNYGYELLFRGCKYARDVNKYLSACAFFSSRLGASGVIGGQALEFEEGRPITEKAILNIYKHKTCHLIIAGLVFAAIIAGASEQELTIIEEFGYHFGIAFQICDDILEVKEKGAVEEKSLLGLIGDENANIILDSNVAMAKERLRALGINSRFLHDLVDFTVDRVRRDDLATKI